MKSFCRLQLKKCLLLFVISSFLGCVSIKTTHLAATTDGSSNNLSKNNASLAQSEAQRMVQLQSYIALDVPYSPIVPLKKDLDNYLKQTLKSRGEAHITVITPPEFQALLKTMTAEQIHSEWNSWLKKDFIPICLGRGEVHDRQRLLQTYYIVTESTDLVAFRHYIKEKYNTVGFDPDLFYPHITISFTDKDLHYEQGIVKNSQSCPLELQTLFHRETIKNQ